MTDKPASQPLPQKHLATLQAQAALRGISVDPLDGDSYSIRQHGLQRDVCGTEALLSLLARMGVGATT